MPLPLLVLLLIPLAVWRISAARGNPRVSPPGKLDLIGGFFAWMLVGVGAAVSAVSYGLIVFLPITAIILWLAAGYCSDSRALWGVAAGIGASLVYFAIVVSMDEGFNIGPGIALSAGIVGGCLIVLAVAMSLLLKRKSGVRQ